MKLFGFLSILPVLLGLAMPAAMPAHAEQSSGRDYGTINHVRLKAPLVRVEGVVDHVFPAHSHHHGADHQHFTVRITRVLDTRGMPADAMPGLVFVALRFGDRDGLDRPIPGLAAGQKIELQGEYIDSGHAYRAQDNDGHPPLPVLHFTHHPVGYIQYDGRRYE